MQVLGGDRIELGEVEVGVDVVDDVVAHLMRPVDEDASAGGVEDDRAVVELLMTRLKALEDGLGHVGVVGIGLRVYVSEGVDTAAMKGAYDGDDEVSVLSRFLELVEFGDSADYGLDTELVGETLRLLRRADVEGEVKLLK